MGHKLRVAMIGLGDIARKGYLPLLGADRDVDLVLITRDPHTRRKLAAQWRTAASYPRIEDALEAHETIDAALVHAATTAHPALTRTLVSAGIPALVDKPLAYSGPAANQLVELARAKRVSLAVGFNRRYAPAYAQVAAQPGLDTVVFTKNRVSWPSQARVKIFEDFIHVIDTLRYMVTPEPEQLVVSARPTSEGDLARIAITLTQGNRIGMGIMDLDSGQVTEYIDAMGPGRAVRISDLVDVTIHEGSQTWIQNRDGWAPVSVQRGFTAMVGAFLDSVRAGTVLDGAEAAATHDLCERVVQAAIAACPELDSR